MHAFYSRYDLLPICIFHYFSCLMFLKCYLLLHHVNCLCATDESLKQMHTTVATLILMFLPALKCSQTLVLIGKWKASQVFSAGGAYYGSNITHHSEMPRLLKSLFLSLLNLFSEVLRFLNHIWWEYSHILNTKNLKWGFMNGPWVIVPLSASAVRLLNTKSISRTVRMSPV